MNPTNPPAPWSHVELEYDDKPAINSSDPYLIIHAITDDEGENVCIAQTEADARLIAAAPCMLSICVEMIDAIDGSHAQVMATAARMKRVIAKATGVQS